MKDLHEWEHRIRDDTAVLVKQILQVLPENGVLIDVGANVGVVTEEIIKIRPCHPYLFEPVPEYWKWCVDKLGKDDRIVIEQLALGDTNDIQTLWMGAVNLGWNTFVTQMKTEDMSELPNVHIIPLDDYVLRHDLKRVDVIKIDVEGFEYKVLRGAKETITRYHPFIFCELGWGHAHPCWNEEVTMIEWLFNNGYQRFDYNSGGTTDVVFRPA